jgi:hypothetical protein
MAVPKIEIPKKELAEFCCRNHFRKLALCYMMTETR